MTNAFLSSFLNDLPTGTYQANQEIISDASIKNGEEVLFKAGHEILLKQDFTVELGASFDVQIETCGN